MLSVSRKMSLRFEIICAAESCQEPKESMEIAEELFSPDVAEQCEVVTEMSDSEYLKLTELAPVNFQLAQLPEQFQRVFRALSATATGRVLC